MWDGKLGPNKCFRELSAKLALRHAWLVQRDRTAQDPMYPEVDGVLLIARDACGVPLSARDAAIVAEAEAVAANGPSAAADFAPRESRRVEGTHADAAGGGHHATAGSVARQPHISLQHLMAGASAQPDDGPKAEGTPEAAAGGADGHRRWRKAVMDTALAMTMAGNA